MNTETPLTETGDWIETRMACPPAAPDDAGAVDWHDLHLNGMPAVHRAISRLQKAQERAEAAHRAEICELRDRVAELEYLWSEEIVANMASPAELRSLAKAADLREIVAELGAGWRIERSPDDAIKPEEQIHATD